MILNLFHRLYMKLEYEGYFQEALGYDCVDQGFVCGSLGYDQEGAVLLELRKDGLTPISSMIAKYTEDDLFDIAEFLHEHCSKPTKRTYHGWGSCGWHCLEFDHQAGQAEFREQVNRMLNIYDSGYELSSDGEVLSLADAGLEALLEAPLPAIDPDNIEARIDVARRKFRRHRSSLSDRRDAIRDLADVLEYLWPKLKGVITSKDERDLFELANKFGIRHHNEAQKLDYDKPIWYSWLFYYYLATIHAVLRLIAKAEGKK